MGKREHRTTFYAPSFSVVFAVKDPIRLVQDPVVEGWLLLARPRPGGCQQLAIGRRQTR